MSRGFISYLSWPACFRYHGPEGRASGDIRSRDLSLPLGPAATMAGRYVMRAGSSPEFLHAGQDRHLFRQHLVDAAPGHHDLDVVFQGAPMGLGLAEDVELLAPEVFGVRDDPGADRPVLRLQSGHPG